MFEKIISIFLVFILLFSQTSTLDVKANNGLDEIREKLVEYEVPKEKIDNLINKLENGETWDSLNLKYEHFEPQFIYKNYTKTVYPDGSIKIEGIISDLSSEKDIYSSGLSTKDKMLILLNEPLRSENVPTDKRKALLEKLANGEVWDSMKAKYSYLKPQIVKDGYRKTIYPDGSVKITGYKPKNKNNLENKLSSDYHIQRGSAYKEMLVVALYFEVTFQQNPSTNEAKIISAESFSCRGIGATVEEVPESEGGRGHLYGWKNPTAAWYSVMATAYGNTASQKCCLEYYANGNQVWQRDNAPF